MFDTIWISWILLEVRCSETVLIIGSKSIRRDEIQYIMYNEVFIFVFLLRFLKLLYKKSRGESDKWSVLNVYK